jgi:hypothetical protein
VPFAFGWYLCDPDQRAGRAIVGRRRGATLARAGTWPRSRARIPPRAMNPAAVGRDLGPLLWSSGPGCSRGPRPDRSPIPPRRSRWPRVVATATRGSLAAVALWCNARASRRARSTERTPGHRDGPWGGDTRQAGAGEREIRGACHPRPADGAGCRPEALTWLGRKPDGSVFWGRGGFRGTAKNGPVPRPAPRRADPPPGAVRESPDVRANLGDTERRHATASRPHSASVLKGVEIENKLIEDEVRTASPGERSRPCIGS